MNPAGKELALLNRVLSYLHQHALAAAAFACSILALAGSSYAAFTISGSQIRNHTIDPVKLNPKFINGNVRAWAIVAPNGRVIAGRGKPKVTPQLGDPGGYVIRWKIKIGRCSTSAIVDPALSRPTEHVGVVGNPAAPLVAGYATGTTSSRHNQTAVQTFDQQGNPVQLGFDVAVIC
jgi:hypothetical protein